MKDSRLIIPSSLRLDTLDKIHAGHQGIQVRKCRDRDRESVWFPGISKQIEDMVTTCPTCHKHRKTTQSPRYINSSARKTRAKSSHQPVLPQWQSVHHCRGLLFEFLRNSSP